MPVPAADPRRAVPGEFRQSATDADNHGVATIAAAYAQDQVQLSRATRRRSSACGTTTSAWTSTTTARVSTFATIDRLVSPRAGLIVKPAEAGLPLRELLARLRAARRRAARVALAHQPGARARAVPNYEVGAKWDARPGLAFTTAVYRLDRTNVVVPDPTDPTRSMLVDGQRTKGVEVARPAAVTAAWQLLAAYAFQDGEITHALSPSAPAGAVLAQLPRHSASRSGTATTSPRGGARGLGLVYRGDMFTATDNTVALPSFLRVDAAIFATLSPRGAGAGRTSRTLLAPTTTRRRRTTSTSRPARRARCGSC